MAGSLATYRTDRARGASSAATVRVVADVLTDKCFRGVGTLASIPEHDVRRHIGCPDNRSVSVFGEQIPTVPRGLTAAPGGLSTPLAVAAAGAQEAPRRRCARPESRLWCRRWRSAASTAKRESLGRVDVMDLLDGELSRAPHPTHWEAAANPRRPGIVQADRPAALFPSATSARQQRHDPSMTLVLMSSLATRQSTPACA